MCALRNGDQTQWQEQDTTSSSNEQFALHLSLSHESELADAKPISEDVKCCLCLEDCTNLQIPTWSDALSEDISIQQAGPVGWL